MRRMIISLSLMFMAMSLPMFAQTTTYDQPIPQATCSSNPEHCTYYPQGTQRFQTGDPWTQLVFDPYHADYCTNFSNNTTTAVWQVLDTDLNPPLSTDPSVSNESAPKLFVLDCIATSINSGLHPSLHAEIVAFSYVKTFKCGRYGLTCHHTYWQTMDGSFIKKEE
jgi:hypothetical protein